MPDNSNNKNFSQRAMHNGTLLGILWIVTSITYIIGLSNIIFSFLFLMLVASSPVFAWYLAVRYRKKECGNQIKYLQAWTYLIIMYVCASLLTAVAQYIYFAFIDNGYFISFIQEQISVIQQMPQIDEATKNALQQVSELWGKLSISDIILQFFNSNMMLTAIITPLTAIFVRRNP